MKRRNFAVRVYFLVLMTLIRPSENAMPEMMSLERPMALLLTLHVRTSWDFFFTFIPCFFLDLFG